MLVRVGVLASSLALAGCAGEPSSPCYSVAPREYSGTIRRFAELPDAALGVVALGGGRVFAFTAADDRRTGWRIDPSGEVVELGGWDGVWGPMTVLADGRVLMVDNGGCRSVVFEPAVPGAPAVRECALADFRADVLWQAPDGRILMFGTGYVDGNDPHGGVAEIDLDGGGSKLDVRTDLSFAGPPERPLQLCDGRVVTATELNGGDFIAPGEAILRFDPATGEATAIELPYSVRDAVQLDTKAALVLGEENLSDQVLFELDLETGATVAIEAPIGVVLQLGRQALVGLADGGALVVAEDGAVHRYSPEQRRLEPLGVAFADLPRALVRASDGRVFAFLDDGAIEVFE